MQNSESSFVTYFVHIDLDTPSRTLVREVADRRIVREVADRRIDRQRHSIIRPVLLNVRIILNMCVYGTDDLD